MNEESTGKCLRQVEHIRGHFVTQIFHSGQPCRGGDRKTFEVVTSTNKLCSLRGTTSL
jgi:hypothetical protein